jgi:hydroxypyruvate isomerase
MSRPTRRQVLAASAAVVGTAAVAAAAEPVVKNGRIKQSVCSWCFTGRGEKWSLDKVCEVTKSLGFTRGFNNLAHRDELVTKTKAAIDATAAARFPNVIAFVGMKWVKPADPKGGEIGRDEAFKNCVDGLKLVAGHAEKAGVNVCVEHLNSRDGSDPMTGHPGYQGDDLDWVMTILKKVGSPRVKLLFDIYHVQIMHGDLLRRIDQCKDWIGHVHTAGVPGRGELDDAQEIHYPAVMRKLIAVGYAGYVGQEFIPTRDPLAGLTQAVRVCDV